MKPAFVLFAAALVALAGCGRPHSDARAAKPAPEPIVAPHVHTVVLEKRPLAIEVTGTVRAQQRAQIASRLTGTVDDIPLTLGQKVRAGEVLLKLAAGENSARAEQARSRLATARRDLERERALFAKGASTDETVRTLEEHATTSEAQLREAETMLSYTLLRAPFDGVVTAKIANTGDLASPGRTLLELDGTGVFEVHAGVPESLASKLAVGASIPVEISASGLSFTGKLAELSSAADVETRTVAVKIAVPAEVSVRSGQFARLTLPGDVRPVIRVPASAVSVFGQMERVFLLGADGAAALRLVRTGARHDGQVEILSGLTEGDRVHLGTPAGSPPEAGR